MPCPWVAGHALSLCPCEQPQAWSPHLPTWRTFTPDPAWRGGPEQIESGMSESPCFSSKSGCFSLTNTFQITVASDPFPERSSDCFFFFLSHLHTSECQLHQLPYAIMATQIWCQNRSFFLKPHPKCTWNISMVSLHHYWSYRYRTKFNQTFCFFSFLFLLAFMIH